MGADPSPRCATYGSSPRVWGNGLVSGLFQDEHIMISEKIIISVDSDFFAAYLAEYGQTAVHVPRHDSEICKAISSEFDSTFHNDESNI